MGYNIKKKNTAEYDVNAVLNKSANTKQSPKKTKLSPLEIKIVKLVCKELTNVEIGERLGYSHRTIDAYRMGILKKIKVKNTAGVIMYAFKNKII